MFTEPADQECGGQGGRGWSSSLVFVSLLKSFQDQCDSEIASEGGSSVCSGGLPHSIVALGKAAVAETCNFS